MNTADQKSSCIICSPVVQKALAQTLQSSWFNRDHFRSIENNIFCTTKSWHLHSVKSSVSEWETEALDFPEHLTQAGLLSCILNRNLEFTRAALISGFNQAQIQNQRRAFPDCTSQTGTNNTTWGDLLLFFPPGSTANTYQQHQNKLICFVRFESSVTK